MPPFRPSRLRLIQASTSSTGATAKQALAERAPPAPFPVVSTCPSPTCECPSMPDGLNIDTASNLNGTMAPYTRHVLIATGQKDWKRRIEDEHSTGTWGPFLSTLKKAFGRRGKYHDLNHNVLVSASSFKPSELDGKIPVAEALVFPSFQRRRMSLDTYNALEQNRLRQFCEEVLRPGSVDEALAAEEDKTKTPTLQLLQCPTILICGHRGRDKRCGILGPILLNEFRRQISHNYTSRLPLTSTWEAHRLSPTKVNLGLISHVGGHKWAGNVILYIPRTWQIRSETGDQRNVPSLLAGHGIWYGRVEPKHVQGIIEETLLKGKVIQDLFRGAIDQHGQVVRIP